MRGNERAVVWLTAVGNRDVFIWRRGDAMWMCVASTRVRVMWCRRVSSAGVVGGYRRRSVARPAAKEVTVDNAAVLKPAPKPA